ncbi:MAG: hypothetical protein R6X10_17125 [Desulfobacterales bacterium]
MNNILLILFLLMFCSPGRTVFAEEQQKETAKTVHEISKEDMEIIKILELLKLMELIENMDLAKNMDILIEEKNNEDTD